MPKRRGEVGERRRGQIIEAASAIIAEQGLQHLSLSAIEEKAGMSRGQLTYYFPAKEEILLAVFDHMIDRMHRRVTAGAPPGCPPGQGGWENVRGFLRFMLLDPPPAEEFHALQYTFLSQIGHREDFRARLAELYEDWRAHQAEDFRQAAAAGEGRRASPRTLATFVQALLHGLAIQRVADPGCYDRQEMLTLCLDLLGIYLGRPEAPPPTTPPPGPNGDGRRRPGKRTTLAE
jgi:AcrR family transcriptional regulator